MIEQTEAALEKLGIEAKLNSDYFLLSCPFARVSHDKGVDNKPSFVIYPLKNYAKCFSCGAYFELQQFFEDFCEFSNQKMDFDFLDIYRPYKPKKEQFNIVLSEECLNGFTPNHPEIINYLTKRGIEYSNLPFKLYYDERNLNLVMPIRNEKSELLGATARKVINRGNKSHHYFGVLTNKCLLGEEITDPTKIVIVEGLTDVLAGYDKSAKLGFDYTFYATLGAKMSEFQARKLIDLDCPIYLAQDLDSAGFRVRKQSKELLSEATVIEKKWKDRSMDIGNMPLKVFENLFN